MTLAYDSRDLPGRISGAFGGEAGRGAMWSAAFLVVLTLHVAAVVRFAEEPAEPDGDPMPPAAVMIDLPPELALPPADSVLTVAADEVVAEAPMDAAAAIDPVEFPPDTPVETVTAADIPDAVESHEVTDVARLDTPAELADTPPDAVTADPADVAETLPETVEIAETLPLDTVETIPSEVALATTPTVTAEASEILTVTPRVKPPPPVVRTPVKVAETRAAPKKQAPATKPRKVASSERQETSTPAASGATTQAAKDAAKSYQSRVREAVARALNRASSERLGTVRIQFVVNADGSLSRVAIVAFSGSAEVGEKLRAAVARTSVPPIPEEVGKRSMVMIVPVRVGRS